MKRMLDGVGVGAIIFNKEGKLFLARRGPKARSERGRWECPGGGLERFEEFGKCIEREFKEEYDTQIKFIKVLGVINHTIPKEDRHWVAIAALCKIVKGKPRIMEPEKCSEIGWFSLSAIEKMPHSVVFEHGLTQMLKNYLANEKTN